MQNLILKIRPAILQVLLIKIFYGNSFKRRKFYFFKKYNLHLFLDPFSLLGQAIMKEKTYEQGTIDLMLENLNKDSIFFDVGANEGFFSLIASKVSYEGKIYLFEPQAQLLPIIERNLVKNNCTNCEIINTGIGEKSYTTKLSIWPETNTGASSIKRKYKFFNKTQLITIQSLDEFIFNNKIHNQIDLIKIDIEGYEINAIEGMKNLLINKRINTILIDYHMSIITHQEKEKCEKFILSCDYKKINTEAEGYAFYKLL